MKLPILNELPTTRETIDVFGGYNHNIRIGDGEFYDMKNLSSSDYPVLSPRMKRRVVCEDCDPQGIVSINSQLCYIDGENFVISGKKIPMDLSTEHNMIPKTIITMGAYVIIFPDKKYINIMDHNDCGSIEAKMTTDEGTVVSIDLCDEFGKIYDESIYTNSSQIDERTPDGYAYIDDEEQMIKKYSAASESVVTVQPYIRISAPGIGEPFEIGDTVFVHDVEYDEIAAMIIGKAHNIKRKGQDFIAFPGYMYDYDTQTTPLTISREIPIMDFVIESGNRLWGCRYGESKNGSFVNEIYASKLGDFMHWYSFDGVSTDSYVASVGTDGEFTGAITYKGYPMFFKENCIHKLYGNYPSNYQVQTTACRGVQRHASKSLVILNEVLYYKATGAVCAYDGSLPVEISDALGDDIHVLDNYSVAGCFDNKYYISMGNGENEYTLFVYDAKRGLWHKEDETCVTAFCTDGTALYYIDSDERDIKAIVKSGTTTENYVNWYAETGIIGTDSPGKKYISRIDVRISLNPGTRVRFFIDYDSEGDWHHLYTMTGTSLRSFSIPIRLRRCDHFKLRIEGIGDAKIYSISKTIEQGDYI